jgi:hypothetical protein
MRKIKINKYPQRDRQQLQERIAASVERDPEPYLQKYVQDPRSHEGRYVSSDLMKETIPEYAASNEARARYSNPLHNSAAVLADEQYSRIINDHSHPERDQAIFLTGIPGAGKTTAVLTAGEPRGQLPEETQKPRFRGFERPSKRALSQPSLPSILCLRRLSKTRWTDLRAKAAAQASTQWQPYRVSCRMACAISMSNSETRLTSWSSTDQAA